MQLASSGLNKNIKQICDYLLLIVYILVVSIVLQVTTTVKISNLSSLYLEIVEHILCPTNSCRGRSLNMCFEGSLPRFQKQKRG